MIDHKEKRLLEALDAYEKGASLATLQMLYADVAADLNNIAEVRRLLVQAKDEMKPSPALAKKIAAGFSLAPHKPAPSLFASRLWRFAAPVGIAALSFMFVIANQTVAPQEEMLLTGVADTSIAEPMSAKFAAPQMEMASAPAEEASFMAMDMSAPADESVESVSDKRLYALQMISLGLLVLLSFMVLAAHWIAIRRG